MIGVKDIIKLFGISVVCFCAVFVCTFMLNFYLDVQSVEGAVTDAMRALYDAQKAMSKFTSAISGGFLGVIAAVMLAFYIKLYVDANSKRIGIIKALGYSDGAIARKFWVFGLSVFAGAAVGFAIGYAVTPVIYRNMTIDGLDIPLHFHPELILLVVAPTLAMTALSCGLAYLSVKRPVTSLLRGKYEKEKPSTKLGEDAKEESIGTKADLRKEERAQKPFLSDMRVGVVSSKKSIAFFVAFACFCFSAMVQMGLSMDELSSAVMGGIILMIGVVLAAVTTVMAVTTLVNRNIKNIAVMKAFGYTMKECAVSVFSGYIPFALIGFGVGTAYQFGLLKLMITYIFDGVAGMPDYSFDVAAFFITLALFIAAYALVTIVYVAKMNRISVKEIMSEE